MSLFHLAGVPSYIVVAELGINQVLRGTLPRPEFPQALREAAPPVWRGRAAMTLRYASGSYVPRGQAAEVAGAPTVAAMNTGHAVPAVRGEWVTNEKRLLRQAGLRDLNAIVGELRPEPGVLARAITEAAKLFDAAV
ncbi:DNA polymerase beta domain-containing protein [Nonomuraea sp. NPDC050404]|uniref:DNA polymerase beta domain-containing protein n=1 Tax=Nonomuraea sp. NPDC050404 TaxID=3155783 RepID=UPI0033E0B702